MVEPADVMVVNLTSGDLFLAEVEVLNDHQVRVKNPMTVTAEPLESGNIGVGFQPWGVMTEKAEFTLSRDHVLYFEPARRDFADLYAQQFNKIAMPDKRIIT